MNPTPFEPLDDVTKEYLKRLVGRKRPLSIRIDIGAGQLATQLKSRWPRTALRDEPAAQKLRDRIVEMIRPLVSRVHPMAGLRMVMVVSPNPQDIPASTKKPVVRAGIDANTGDVIHHFRAPDTDSEETIAAKIPMGLTLICHPTGIQDEKWTQEQGQGGNLYRHEEGSRVEAREAPMDESGNKTKGPQRPKAAAMVRRDPPAQEQTARAQTVATEVKQIRQSEVELTDTKSRTGGRARGGRAPRPTASPVTRMQVCQSVESRKAPTNAPAEKPKTAPTQSSPMKIAQRNILLPVPEPV